MPNVVAKLPLDSPLWGRLSACYSAENAVARLREIVATRQLGEAWRGLCDEMLHQGSVYGVSSAAIPQLIDVAPHLDAASRRDLWIEIGFMVTAGADRFSSPHAAGLQEGLTAALDAAEAAVVRDFLADAELTPDESCYYALACVALAGHRVGSALWQFPSASNGYIQVTCPECKTVWELDGFADPLTLPCSVPAFPGPASGPAPDRAAAWRDAAGAIERAWRGQVLAPVLMPAPFLQPARATGETAGRLAGFRDGRTMLAAGDAGGVVQLWDPATRMPVTALFRRPGWRVVSLMAVNFVNHPPWQGTDLVAVYNNLRVDVWESGSVHGRLSTMAPGVAKLAAAGHRHITGASASPRRLGHRQPVLLADRNGTVSMWETFGIRLSDPLPPDPAHREVTGIAVLPGAGNGITVVTASRADCNLRIWEPQRGSVALLPLSVRPRFLLNANDALLIGHDDGLTAISLTIDTV